MAHRLEFFRRESPGLPGSISSFVSAVSVMLLFTSQYVGSQDLTSSTVSPEYICGECKTSHCIEVKDCSVMCGTCETPMYNFKPIHSFCEGSRKRRQMPPATPPAVPVTPTTIAPTTTTVKNAWICKNCSVAGCKKCIDHEETPACETCQDGYQFNNDTKTCYTEPDPEPEESLSGVAIAGIVIAVVCTVAISIIIIVLVLRKFRGSRDVTAQSEKIKPVSSAGGNFSSNAPQIAKINAKELLRKHDQITRYMKDPTSKDSPKNTPKYCRSASQENKELQELGPAPPPPAEPNDYTDMHQKYDPLDPTNQNDTELYLPIQHDDAPLYGNISAVENEFRQAEGLYENTVQRGQQGVNKASSANGNTAKHPVLTQSQESFEHYEPVGTASAVPDALEGCLHDDSAMLVHNQESAESAEIYMNEDVDDVYQNA